MSYINEYVRNIAFYLIFMSLAGVILPEGKYKKYINVILGLVLIVILLSPFYRFLNTGNFDVDDLLDSLNISTAFTSDISNYEDMRNRVIKGEFLVSLRSHTENILRDSEYEYALNDISADFDINTGEIRSIHLKVQKRASPPDETEQTRRPFIRIEPIRISNSFGTPIEESQEITNMRRMISHFYGVPIENILIDVQEMK